MPQSIVEAALEQLTPAQRDAIKAEHAARIMRVAIDTAEKIGGIVEQAQLAARPLPPEISRDEAALDPSTKARGHG